MLGGRTCLGWGPDMSELGLWNPDKEEGPDISGLGADMSGMIGVFGGRVNF
jgi:hypothetical protein